MAFAKNLRCDQQTLVCDGLDRIGAISNDGMDVADGDATESTRSAMQARWVG